MLKKCYKKSINDVQRALQKVERKSFDNTQKMLQIVFSQQPMNVKKSWTPKFKQQKMLQINFLQQSTTVAKTKDNIRWRTFASFLNVVVFQLFGNIEAYNIWPNIVKGILQHFCSLQKAIFDVVERKWRAPENNLSKASKIFSKCINE